MELLEPDDLDLLERLIRDSHTWVLVDGLAGDVAVKLLVEHPRGGPRLDAWAADDDFWVRRSALLALGGLLKAGAPLDRSPATRTPCSTRGSSSSARRSAGCCVRWARSARTRCTSGCGRGPHASSGVTIREAVKYLQPEQREELMRAYKGLGA